MRITMNFYLVINNGSGVRAWLARDYNLCVSGRLSSPPVHSI